MSVTKVAAAETFETKHSNEMKWGQDGDILMTFYFQVDRPEAKAVGAAVQDVGDC